MPPPNPPRVRRKIKIPQGVQKMMFCVTTPRMSVWLLGKLQITTDPKTSHAEARGFVVGDLFFLSQIYFL